MAFRSSHLSPILPSIPDTYFWLVAVWKIINWQPPPSLYFLLLHLVTPNDGTFSPTQSNSVVPPLQHTATNPQLIVMSCRLTATTKGQDPTFLSIFLMWLVLAPQTREPTAAPPNLMARPLRKPIGSGSAMSWWCCLPTHGGRGLKPVQGRTSWLMLVVVRCCCQQKKHFEFEHLSPMTLTTTVMMMTMMTTTTVAMKRRNTSARQQRQQQQCWRWR